MHNVVVPYENIDQKNKGILLHYTDIKFETQEAK